MDFWRIVGILNKRKWLILLSVLATIALTYGSTRLSGSRWEATVRFVVPSVPGVPGSAEDMGSDSSGGIIGARSRATMYGAMARSEDVVFKAEQKAGLLSRVPGDVLGTIEFAAVSPRLYELKLLDSNPSRAEKLVNALADAFVAKNEALQVQSADKAVATLRRQLDEADARLAATRSRYQSYLDQKHILQNVNTDRGLVAQQYQSARVRRADLKVSIAAAEAVLHTREQELLKTPRTITVTNPPLPNPRVKQYESDLADASAKLDALRKRYTDDWPAVKQAIADRDTAAANLAAERATQSTVTSTEPNPAYRQTQDAMAALRQQIVGYNAQLAELGTDVAASETQLGAYKKVDSPVSSLEADVTAQTEARTSLVQRLTGAELARDAASRQFPIVVMDYCDDDHNPVVNANAGRTKKRLLLGVICALVGSLVLVIGFDSIDVRLRSVKQAEIVLPARILAAIPHPMGEVTYSSLARATELQPQSLHSEAFRFLALQLLNPASAIRSLMVLSAKAEQGSTTTISNLAITLAQAGKRVVVVDANVRTAEMHRVFEIPNDFGYTDLISNPSEETWARAVRPTSTPNLWVITSGARPENPWQLFRSSNLREVASRLLAMADFVLYDTPSGLLFTDALNLAPVVDAAFMCIRAYEPLTGGEERLMKLLHEAGVPVLGCVLNDVPASVVEGYQNYEHYYGPGAGGGEPAAIAAPMASPPVVMAPAIALD